MSSAPKRRRYARKAGRLSTRDLLAPSGARLLTPLARGIRVLNPTVSTIAAVVRPFGNAHPAREADDRCPSVAWRVAVGSGDRHRRSAKGRAAVRWPRRT